MRCRPWSATPVAFGHFPWRRAEIDPGGILVGTPRGGFARLARRLVGHGAVLIGGVPFVVALSFSLHARRLNDVGTALLRTSLCRLRGLVARHAGLRFFGHG